MFHVAAIDVGSNAVRLLLAKVGDNHHHEIIERVRIPLRLGKEAFRNQKFSAEMMDKTGRIFGRLQSLMKQHQVSTYTAVATAAFRESKNAQQLRDHIVQKTGILVKTIEGEEEAHIIWTAVKHALPLTERPTFLIDIGGGSVEIVIVKNKKKVAQKSFNIGTLRILELQDDQSAQEKHLRKFKDSLEEFFKLHDFQEKECSPIGTGGNLRRLGKLRKFALHKKKMHFINRTEVSDLYKLLKKISVLKRVKKYHLLYDRAEVIVPAMEILLAVSEVRKIRKIILPNVGLADGLVYQMLHEPQI